MGATVFESHRTQALEQLRSHWDEVQQQLSPRLILLNAGSGGGKTRLLQEFYDSLAKDATQLYWGPGLTPKAAPRSLRDLEKSRKRVVDLDLCASSEVPAWLWLGLACSSTTEGGAENEPVGDNLLPQLEYHVAAMAQRRGKGEEIWSGAGKIGWGVAQLLAEVASMGGAVATTLKGASTVLNALGEESRELDEDEIFAARTARGVATLRELTSSSGALPIIVVIDDAWLASSGSLTVLADAMVEGEGNRYQGGVFFEPGTPLAERPLLIVATVWPHVLKENDPVPRFQRWIDGLEGAGGQVDRLSPRAFAPLEDSRALELATEWLPDLQTESRRDLVSRATEKTPLLIMRYVAAVHEAHPLDDGSVTSLPKEWLDKLPATLEDAMRQWFDSLEPEARLACALGARVGFSFPNASIAAVLAEEFAESSQEGFLKAIQKAEANQGALASDPASPFPASLELCSFENEQLHHYARSQFHAFPRIQGLDLPARVHWFRTLFAEMRTEYLTGTFIPLTALVKPIRELIEPAAATLDTDEVFLLRRILRDYDGASRILRETERGPTDFRFGFAAWLSGSAVEAEPGTWLKAMEALKNSRYLAYAGRRFLNSVRRSGDNSLTPSAMKLLGRRLERAEAALVYAALAPVEERETVIAALKAAMPSEHVAWKLVELLPENEALEVLRQVMPNEQAALKLAVLLPSEAIELLRQVMPSPMAALKLAELLPGEEAIEVLRQVMPNEHAALKLAALLPSEAIELLRQAMPSEQAALKLAELLPRVEAIEALEQVMPREQPALRLAELLPEKEGTEALWQAMPDEQVAVALSELLPPPEATDALRQAMPAPLAALRLAELLPHEEAVAALREAMPDQNVALKLADLLPQEQAIEALREVLPGVDVALKLADLLEDVDESIAVLRSVPANPSVRAAISRFHAEKEHVAGRQVVRYMPADTDALDEVLDNLLRTVQSASDLKSIVQTEDGGHDFRLFLAREGRTSAKAALVFGWFVRDWHPESRPLALELLEVHASRDKACAELLPDLQEHT